MWTPEAAEGEQEVRKCRHRIASYLHGSGLDVGCGTEKICAEAIGIDFQGSAADMKLDLSAIDSLRIFSDDYFDYVFSSHCLEDMQLTEATLKEWWRVLKYGGHLILYCPDPDYYPRPGTTGANSEHKHDLYWQDVWKIIKGFGNAKLIQHSRHNESNEYSWQLIVQKRMSFIRKPFELLSDKILGKNNDRLLFPHKKSEKECLIIRYGALGDALWATPALRELKKQGWRIIYNCTDYSAQVLRENPNIGQFLIQVKDAIPNEQLGDYWDDLGKEFKKVINFSGSVEGSLLKLEGTDEYKWSHNKRHKECNINYMDKTMEVAGFPQIKGQLPELYFSEIEEQQVQLLRAALKDKFLVVWSLDGSSFHKGYPWTPFVTGEMAKNHKDVKVITVGDYRCQMIEPRNPAIIPKAGVLTIRQAMLLTKYADLVIGPETGILNAASCYDTPKIVFLSHSSIENLTKYWKNCTSLKPNNCRCQPCHRLIFSNSCPKEIIKTPYQGRTIDVPVVRCAHNISAEVVYKAFLGYYKKWKKG